MIRSMVVPVRLAAWLVLIAVLIVTVSPPEYRPHVWSANAERFAAFLVCGGLFAAAYPRKWLAVLCLVLAAAALFEIAQALVPDRHPAAKDFVIKALGGGIGVAAGVLVHFYACSFSGPAMASESDRQGPPSQKERVSANDNARS